MLAIKRSSLRSIVNCYIKGVNANAVIDPTNGENPLHLAVRVSFLVFISRVRTLQFAGPGIRFFLPIGPGPGFPG